MNGTLVGIQSYEDDFSKIPRIQITNSKVFDSTTAIINAHKQMENGSLVSGQYRFELTEVSRPERTEPTIDGALLSSNAALDTWDEIYDFDTDGMVPNPWYQTAPVEFELAFNKPGDYVYQLREVVEEEDRDPAIVYDETEKTVTVHVTEDAEDNLTAEVDYGTEGEPLFVNRMKPGKLKISKTVTDATELAKDTVFAFALQLTDADENPVEGAFPVRIYDAVTNAHLEELDGTVSNGGTISLKGGQYAFVDQLPNGTRYEITEDLSQTPGFIQTEAENAEGTVAANTEIAVRFVNRYETNGELRIPIEKTFVNGVIKERQFAFVLKNADGSIIKRAYITPNTGNPEKGTAEFVLYYTIEDEGKEYTYTIEEAVDEQDGKVIYDRHVETVTVKVNDNGQGEMVAAATYYSENADGELVADASKSSLSFRNGRIYELQIRKTVKGNLGDREKGFRFTIALKTAAQEAYIPEELPDGWSGENGEYTFYLKDGTFTTILLPYGTQYAIEEESEGYRAAVTITDGEGNEVTNLGTGANAKGVLETDQTVEYTNTRGVEIPTGVDLDMRPVIAGTALLGLGIALLILGNRRRKRRRAEEE
ncbi:MAG: hypothetical protein IJK01_01185 [Clostridia bacterium]|nr:hypothetical protein [Clostridia bacterium]